LKDPFEAKSNGTTTGSAFFLNFEPNEEDPSKRNLYALFVSVQDRRREVDEGDVWAQLVLKGIFVADTKMIAGQPVGNLYIAWDLDG